MEFDPIGAIQRTIATAPFAAIAAVILGGPTLLYFMARTAFFSRSDRRAPSSGRMLWACPQCSSVNESIHDRCYTCHFEPQPEDDITIIDPDTGRPLTPVVKPWTVRTAQAAAPRTMADRPAVAVGPGRTAMASTRAPIAAPPATPTPSPTPVMAGTPVGTAPTSPSSETGVLHRVGVRRPFDPPSRR